MSALLSNADVLSSIGVLILGAAIVIVAIWTTVLSVKVSKLKKMVLMEQERSAELARSMAMGGRRGPAPQPPLAVMAPAEAAPERPADILVAPEEEEARPKKPKARKGKPTIPFGENKAAQARAQQAYAANADDSAFDPDSVDLNRVESMCPANMGTIPADAHTVRSASPVAVDGNGHRRQGRQREPRQREPRQRTDSRPLSERTTDKLAPVATRRAVSETKASFDRVGEELRSHNGTSNAWVEEDARRVVERHERAARRQRLSERRQQEQLRRQAESIVAEHHRQMSQIR